MNNHITHIDQESWLEDPRFPDVSLQLLVSQTHSASASVIRVRVNAGGVIATHTHESETEIVYILSGMVTLVMDEIDYPLTAGACAVIPKGMAHRVYNAGTETAEILAVHSPPTR